jgi:putative acetyltransferase
VIRTFADADLEQVLDVWYEASIVAHSFLPAEFFVAERRALADRWLPAADTFVYEVDGRVGGFASLVDDELGGLFVHPDHQRRGIGRALVDHARSLRTTLEVDVFAENEDGVRFYLAYGFEPVGTDLDPLTGHQRRRLRLT